MTLPVVQRLRDAAAGMNDERVSMRAMAQALGPEAQGALLLLISVPCLLPVPGVGSVMGLGMVALAVSMWRGHAITGLPPRVAQVDIPRLWAQRVLSVLASAYALAGRYAKARWSHLVGHQWRPLTAAVIGLMALIVLMPIPFGNVLPALALICLGLGLAFQDGLAVMLGFAVSGLALLFTGWLVLTAWTMSSAWLQHL
jgi:hypothetical protein